MSDDPQTAWVRWIWSAAPAPKGSAQAWGLQGLARSGPNSEVALTRGLEVYRQNAKALAVRALGAAYPRLRLGLGTDDFTGLAWAFARAHPPKCGDLSRWGAELATFLCAQPSMEPEWPELARLDWALHACADAADEVQDAELIAQLQIGPDRSLRLSQTLRRLGLGVGAWEMAVACGAPEWEGAGRELLVWRRGWRPCWAALPPGWALWLDLLLEGRPLGEALGRSAQATPELDAGRALQAALNQGWILGVDAGR